MLRFSQQSPAYKPPHATATKVFLCLTAGGILNVGLWQLASQTICMGVVSAPLSISCRRLTVMRRRREVARGLRYMTFESLREGGDVRSVPSRRRVCTRQGSKGCYARFLIVSTGSIDALQPIAVRRSWACLPGHKRPHSSQAVGPVQLALGGIRRQPPVPDAVLVGA